MLPTEAVPEAVLTKHVGRTVVVKGQWHPGNRWQPTHEGMNLPMPVDPDRQVVIRGDGIKASSIELTDGK